MLRSRRHSRASTAGRCGWPSTAASSYEDKEIELMDAITDFRVAEAAHQCILMQIAVGLKWLRERKHRGD
jgi:hypothetical protein